MSSLLIMCVMQELARPRCWTSLLGGRLGAGSPGALCLMAWRERGCSTRRWATLSRCGACALSLTSVHRNPDRAPQSVLSIFSTQPSPLSRPPKYGMYPLHPSESHECASHLGPCPDPASFVTPGGHPRPVHNSKRGPGLCRKAGMYHALVRVEGGELSGC